jgi:hypothetical protein
MGFKEAVAKKFREVTKQRLCENEEARGWRHLFTPEEREELRGASGDMHYGDEPLYYSDPPEWP